jgi:hypothetical protein
MTPNNATRSPETILRKEKGRRILTGVNEISRYCKQKPRRTLYLISTGRIPVFRLGRRIHACCDQLDAVLSASES